MKRRTYERLLAAAVEAAARGAAQPAEAPQRRWRKVLAAVGAPAGIILGVVGTLAAGPVASAWDQRNDPAGSIVSIDRRPATVAIGGNLHTLAVREDAHSHAGTYFLVIHPVGEGSNGELYPRRLPQDADIVSACDGTPDLRCTTVNLSGDKVQSSKFRLTLYFVSDEHFGSFDDIAATFDPFPGKVLPAPADAVDTVTVTRSS